jgi:hypothetical protein
MFRSSSDHHQGLLYMYKLHYALSLFIFGSLMNAGGVPYTRCIYVGGGVSFLVMIVVC